MFQYLGIDYAGVFGTHILRLLTHDDDTPYMDYILRLRDNPIARAVKLADLAHNSDSSRLDYVDDRSRAREEKYRQAMALLNEPFIP